MALNDISEKLARNDLAAFETQGRFIQSRYKEKTLERSSRRCRRSRSRSSSSSSSHFLQHIAMLAKRRRRQRRVGPLAIEADRAADHRHLAQRAAAGRRSARRDEPPADRPAPG